MSYCEKNATQTGYLANEIHEIDTDLSEADREEKHRLIKQVNNILLLIYNSRKVYFLANLIFISTCSV